ncbi:MAG: putative toxin-antitoxin system toxin component, PIN family [Betaproteobacteria bacterium RIFCSPLOWO2_12_FULL_62_58]|nr:MAG: putative toxin-antitoxin system toxin component, PIN family [Betaproteobacteria bacterium RIFCSPLOWO2_02_FULL_62_79]OGA52150.1 MAG: putative toxin-antitoxin system toxin component, PIN family [Betaproteobacteria bacterium RIFCSPLOWO2_12_FULL_62_58]
MRAVADTNTVVSGLLWYGAPRTFLDTARAGAISLYTSGALLAELADVLPRAKLAKRVAASGMSVKELARRYALLAQRITPAEIDPVVLADADDDAVIACALAARADLIVSGDKRVRNLKTYHGIRIVGVNEALALIAKP